MQAIIGLADSAAASSVPGSGLFPGPLSVAIHLMNRVHWVWRWHFMVTQVYSSSTNLKKLVAGHALNFFVGNNFLLRLGAQVVMIATRILQLGKQKVVTYAAYCEFYDAVANTYPLRVKVSLPREEDSFALRLLGPVEYLWIMKKKEAFMVYISRVIRCAALLFREMLKVSMCYMDVIEAFSLSSENRDLAVNHFFLNTASLLDEITENKHSIHAELIRHKPLVQQILSGLGSPFKADKLIDAVAASLTVTQRAYSTVKTVYNYSEDFVKQGLSTLTSSVGLQPGLLLPKDPNPIRPLAAGAT